MPTVMLSGSMRQRIGGVGAVEVAGDTVAEVVRALETSYPALRGWVIDERGAVRRHVRIFLRGAAVGLDAAVAPRDEVHIVGSISGG